MFVGFFSGVVNCWEFLLPVADLHMIIVNNASCFQVVGVSHINRPVTVCR